MGSRGAALPLALLLCVTLGLVAAAAAALALTAVRIAVNLDASQRALDVAEAGLARGAERLAAAYERGGSPQDSILIVPADTLNGFTYEVRAEMRRERATQDLNRNGLRGEVVRYDRSWGYSQALAPGPPGPPGEPVRVITSRAQGVAAAQELSQEVALERDPLVTEPRARGAWRVIALRWSSLLDPP